MDRTDCLSETQMSRQLNRVELSKTKLQHTGHDSNSHAFILRHPKLWINRFRRRRKVSRTDKRPRSPRATSSDAARMEFTLDHGGNKPNASVVGNEQLTFPQKTPLVAVARVVETAHQDDNLDSSNSNTRHDGFALARAFARSEKDPAQTPEHDLNCNSIQNELTGPTIHVVEPPRLPNLKRFSNHGGLVVLRSSQLAVVTDLQSLPCTALNYPLATLATLTPALFGTIPGTEGYAPRTSPVTEQLTSAAFATALGQTRPSGYSQPEFRTSEQNSGTGGGGSQSRLSAAGTGRIERPRPARFGAASNRSRSIRSTSRGTGNDGCLWWICPFARINPYKHFKCFVARIDTIPHLKQHLTRSHTLLHCTSCMAVFETVEERESHHISRRSNPCPDRSGQVELDGFTEVQMEALRKTRVADSQDGWDQIWNEVVKRRSPKPFQTTRSPLIRDEVKELFAILSELISPHSQDIVGRIRGIHPLPETAIRGALPVPQHLDWYEALIRDAWKEFIKFSTENPLSDVANTFPEDQDRTPTSPANAGHGNAGPQGSLPRETPGPSHNSIRQFGSSNWDAESQTPHTLFGSSQQSGLPPTGLSDISSGFGNSYNSSITTFTSDTHYEAAPDSRREARRSRDPQSFLNPRIHRHSTPSSSMSRPIIGMGVSYHRGQEEDPYPLSPQNNFGNMQHAAVFSTPYEVSQPHSQAVDMQQVLPSAYQLNNVFDRQGGLTTFGSGMAQAATMDQNQLHESVGDGVSRSAAVGTVGVSDEALGMGTTADALIMSPLHTNLDEEDFGSLDDALVYGTDISFTLERFLNKEETEDP